MTSFIDMLASHHWTEADIVNRTEAIIAAEFPPAQVAIINRVVTAAAAGIYSLTDEELAEVERYNAVCLTAREEGNLARADMALLLAAMEYENAVAKLLQAVPEPARIVVTDEENITREIDNPAVVADAIERAAAQAVVDAASADVLELAERRKPPVALVSDEPPAAVVPEEEAPAAPVPEEAPPAAPVPEEEAPA